MLMAGEPLRTRSGEGTQKAQRGHKKHKKERAQSSLCASCVLFCAFCVPAPCLSTYWYSLQQDQHVANGLVETHERRTSDDVVADVQLGNLRDAGDRTDIAIGKPVSGED